MSEGASGVRVTLLEGAERPGLIAELSVTTGLAEREVTDLIRATSDRLRRTIGAKSALRLRDTSIRAVDCAGLVRLSPRVELEIVPKFLSPDDPSWREDFFLIATLSKVGRIFPAERIRAGHADRGDLASLVGQAMISLFWENYRQPLRTYRSRRIKEFAYDGDVEPEELFLPDPDGFEQGVTVFDRSNPYNAIIRQAVKDLLPEVRDAETRHQLVRMAEALSPQERLRAGARPVRVPSRHRRWQPLYDLSLQVINGFGVGYEAVGLFGPGFVLKTWPAWEDLVLLVTRTALDDWDVLGQQRYHLGTRTRAKTRSLRVRPDVAIRPKGAAHQVLLLDAKYKAQVQKGQTRVVEADVYEALAFMQATGCTRTVLLYPKASSGAAAPPGSCSEFEIIRVGAREIRAFEVECRGLARAGLRVFADTLGSVLRPLLV